LNQQGHSAEQRQSGRQYFLTISHPSRVKDAEMQKSQAIQPSDQILFGDIKGTSKITTRQAENPSIDSFPPSNHTIPSLGCLSTKPTKVSYLQCQCAEIY